jgi:hypothetical protein
MCQKAYSTDMVLSTHGHNANLIDTWKRKELCIARDNTYKMYMFVITDRRNKQTIRGKAAHTALRCG